MFRLGYLYLLFQALYLLFARFALHSTAGPALTRPYWLLWYLPVLIFCHLLLPGLDAVPPRCRWLVLLGCLGLALGVGFVAGIGYPFALGRFCSFLPYFVLGHYAGQWHGRQVPRPSLKWTVFGSLAVAVTAALTCTVLPLPRKVLWGAEGFAVTGAPWWTELLAPAVALAWLTFLVRVLLPLLDRPIPLVTTLGKNTLPVFLLHGFVIQFLRYHQLLSRANLLHALGLSLLLVAALGNPPVAALFQRFFTGRWLEKLWARIKQ